MKGNLLRGVLTPVVAATLFLAGIRPAGAHCDTLDGPVIQDARKALQVEKVTPALKWVKAKDEQAVRAAFAKALRAKGKKGAAAAETRFFATLVKVHRAGEGAPFTGLKAAGSVEPVVAEADRALVSGSADALVKMVTGAVASGIDERHRRAAAAYRTKDESVAAGREFVEAYVEYTHYVERLHQDATAKEGHLKHQGKQGHAPATHGDEGRQ